MVPEPAIKGKTYEAVECAGGATSCAVPQRKENEGAGGASGACRAHDAQRPLLLLRR